MLKRAMLFFVLAWATPARADVEIPVGPFRCTFTDSRIVAVEATCKKITTNMLTRGWSGTCQLCGIDANRVRRTCLTISGGMEPNSICPTRIKVPSTVFDGAEVRCKYGERPKTLLGLTCSVKKGKRGFAGVCDATILEHGKRTCFRGYGTIDQPKSLPAPQPPRQTPSRETKNASF